MASRNSALYPRHLGAARFVPSRGGHTGSRENHDRRGLQPSRQRCLAALPPRRPSESPRRPSHLETKSVTLEKTGQQVGTVIQNFLHSQIQNTVRCVCCLCVWRSRRDFLQCLLSGFLSAVNTSPPNHLMPWFSMNFKDGGQFIHLTPNKKSPLKELKLSFSAFFFIYIFFNFSDSSHPIWRMLKIRQSSWALLLPLPWTANAPLSWYFHIFLCECVSSVTPDAPPQGDSVPSRTGHFIHCEWTLTFLCTRAHQVCRKSDFPAQMKSISDLQSKDGKHTHDPVYLTSPRCEFELEDLQR